MTAMIALAALILANPMRRGALDFVDFVNLVSIPDFCLNNLNQSTRS